MQFSSLTFKLIGIFTIYAFACGALAAPATAESFQDHFFSRLLDPLGTSTLLGMSILVIGVFLFASGEVIQPGAWSKAGVKSRRPAWPIILLIALLMSSILTCGIAAIIIFGGTPSGDPIEMGAYFTAAMLEVILGAIMAGVLLFLRLPRSVFLPALGILLTSIGTLGVLFWFGNSALP